MADVDTVVVGAGAVGLATARALATGGRDVIVLERREAFGTEISARSSEVIHAGVHYPPGSWKARLCVAGRRAMYAFCESRGVRAERTTKLIVAVEEAELPALEALFRRGQENGVEGLELWDGARARALEPNLAAAGAIWSPESGLVDSHGYMLALLGEIEAHGGALALGAPFLDAKRHPEGWAVRAGGEEELVLVCRHLVLAGGLGVADAARAVEGADPARIDPIRYAKGSYFKVTGKAPFARLIYPLPTPAGLGVHYTPEPMGGGKFGPDVEMVDRLDYSVDPARRALFAEDIRRFWPSLDPEKLTPDYAGVRPKIRNAPHAFEDFHIEGPDVHGLAGHWRLMGIDSPGLTSSFAIGEEVARRVASGGGA
jgi:L-2-hydroxyglutarate oxidase LhgO